MKNKDTKGINVKKEENFSEWYSQVVQKAELADYSTVKGCMVIRPNAYSVWESIQEYFNKRIKKIGVRNAYFPLFIPESFFKKEAEHAEGFSPEVAWIANKEEGERLAVRPTSETIMYDSYSKWIRSHRDLPLRINQWCNVVRWETKATKLFLRTREFLWQEGHCVYATEKSCDKETLAYLKEYKKLCEDVLAIPVLMGKKTDKEKFAGGHYTLSIEGVMPDGKALQMGTSHNLGQGFAKGFGISFEGEDDKQHLPWQNSWGVSTRLIGALVMTHGDDKGMVLPPKLAYNKLVIVPIFMGKDEKVLKKSKEIYSKLKSFNGILDDRKEYRPGWKFNQWELQGIPLRIEIGPKDLEQKQVVIVRRDNNKKEFVQITKVKERVGELLVEIQKDLLDKAKKNMNSMVVDVNNLKEFEKAVKDKKISRGCWCGSMGCEENIKDKLGVVTLNMPFDQPKKLGKCVYCGSEGKYLIYFGKSY